MVIAPVAIHENRRRRVVSDVNISKNFRGVLQLCGNTKIWSAAIFGQAAAFRQAASSELLTNEGKMRSNVYVAQAIF